MFRTVTFPAPESALKALNRTDATATFLLTDAGSKFVEDCEAIIQKRKVYGSWMGVQRGQDARAMACHGDASSVEASDRLLATYDALSIPANRNRRVLDVVGGAPVVPAYLSGNPLNMIRRARFQDDGAPIVLCFDGTTSGGIDADDMRARGIAVLALARALSTRRPVEIWVGAGLDAHGNNGAWVMANINTTPMDIATAAHYLTHPSIIRGYGYDTLMAKRQSGGYSSAGGWPYGGMNETVGDVQIWEDHCRMAFPHATDIIAIPGIINSDVMLKNPKAWLASKVAQYLGDDQD